MLPKDVEQLMLLTFDMFEMDLSNRRGGEKSARFDFSMRCEIFVDILPKEDEQLTLLTFDMLEMARSIRRGDEKSARFDFSMRCEMFADTDGFACSLASS